MPAVFKGKLSVGRFKPSFRRVPERARCGDSRNLPELFAEGFLSWVHDNTQGSRAHSSFRPHGTLENRFPNQSFPSLFFSLLVCATFETLCRPLNHFYGLMLPHRDRGSTSCENNLLLPLLLFLLVEVALAPPL